MNLFVLLMRIIFSSAKITVFVKGNGLTSSLKYARLVLIVQPLALKRRAPRDKWVQSFWFSEAP